MKKQTPKSDNSGVWLWGRHTVMAALANRNRRIHRLVVSDNAEKRLGECSLPLEPQRLDTRKIEALLPPGAVHQGIAILTDPLPWHALEDVIHSGKKGPLVVLDQVTDPRNVGAVFRSAAAFGAPAVVMQTRATPRMSGVLAKAAAGALDAVAPVRVTNIARAIGSLNDQGWTTLALVAGQGRAVTALNTVEPNRCALVLGAEGKGIRPLIRTRCSDTAHIPLPADTMPSLNISVAAAIALFQLARPK